MGQSKEYIRDKRSPKPLSPYVSKVMRSNKAKNTGPEMLLRRWLFRNGFRGYRLNYKKLPGRPDVCFVKKKVALFVHGCFWHRCPNCSNNIPKHNSTFWKQKFENNVSRDARKIKALKELGWQPIVIWECEITPVINEETKSKIFKILNRDE